MSTGHLQLVGFKSHGPCSPNKKGHPFIYLSIKTDWRTSGSEAGLDCIFAFGKNYRVAAVKTGGKQMSTGHLQLVGFKSPCPCSPNKKGHPDGCPFLFGGRGGT